MYNCGPTVYDFQHIGNLRAYVFADVLRRTLETNGYDVTQVINITDVGHLVSDGDTGEDKMTKGLEKEDLPITLEAMAKLGDKYADIFKADLKKLNITTPEYFPKASEHIAEDIALVERLAEKGVTYKTDDGIYFDTEKIQNYGKLIAGDVSSDDRQERVKNEQKKNSRDFALWKFDNKLGWESPWGQGFPGWHIECSVMSMQYLGESFDIHTGGIDHIPVHHTNEIAQSETASGEEMAQFWLHNDFISIADEKISKSIGNTLYLKDIIQRGIHPLAYRYLLLGARYRTKMNFSWDALEAASAALKKLWRFMREHSHNDGDISKKHAAAFMEAINDDLNTAKALSVVWETLDDEDISSADKAASLSAYNEILALNLTSPPETKIPDEVKELAEKRQQARENGDYDEADKLRDIINKKGFQLNDSDDGTQITKQ